MRNLNLVNYKRFQLIAAQVQTELIATATQSPQSLPAQTLLPAANPSRSFGSKNAFISELSSSPNVHCSVFGLGSAVKLVDQTPKN